MNQGQTRTRRPSGRAILSATSESTGAYAFYLALKAGATLEVQQGLIATYFLTSTEIEEARIAASLPDWSPDATVYLVA